MSHDTGSSQELSEAAEKTKKKKERKKNFFLSNLCIFLSVLLIIAGGLITSITIRQGSVFAKDAYESAKATAAEDAYNIFYDSAYASAERKYHVSNKISIEVAEVREKADLEVLKVSDVEYVIKSKNDSDGGIEAWMEYYGEGVYTVDMKASEFVIDSDRQYVLVRVPKPELSNCRITNANELFWQNSVINKSNAVGVDLADELTKEGYAKLNNYMQSNAKFYKNAKDTATMVIGDLVKGLNPNLPELVVDVEFMDNTFF